MNYLYSFLLVLASIALLPSNPVWAERAVQDAEFEPPKNVILFVSDGAGPASFTMARHYVWDHLGREGLALDPIQSGAIRTHSSDNRVTDSAASGTAFSTGIKTYNGAIAVNPDREPVPTVLEAAEKQGMATGLVATSRITHATPAAFASHVPNRGMEAEIAVQELASGVDVIFGGGRRYFLPTSEDGSREDGRNLFEEAREKGYEVVLDRQAFDAGYEAPVLGLFTSDHMSYEIDRDSLDEPSLAEMTARAIDLLNDDPDGFFLMVEGSRIDHAGHNHDAAAHLHEMLAFDDAVAVALEYARSNGETLVVSTSDHETGGLTLGRTVERSSGYGWEPQVLARVTSSVGPIIDALHAGDMKPEEVIASYTGIDDLTEEELEILQDAIDGNRRLDHAVGELVGRRAVLGWTTGGHTGVDVGLYAYGPGSELFRGNRDNTYIGRAIARVLNLDLAGVQAALVPAE